MKRTTILINGVKAEVNIPNSLLEEDKKMKIKWNK